MSYPDHPYAGTYPLITGDEWNDLVNSIRAHGLLEPIWLHQGQILDGRNRNRACAEAGVEPRFREYEGDDQSALEFVKAMNRHRRHLTAGQKAIAAGKYYGFYAELAKERQGARTDLAPDKDLCATWRRSPTEKPEPKVERSSAEAAKITGASSRSVERARKVTTEAPDLIERVWKGDLELGRAERIIRDRHAEKRRVTQAREDAENHPEKPRCDIRHGDFREVLADLRNIDAIITDPPYPREYLPLLGDLAAWADKVLTPDGVLAVLFGQTYLPEVYRLLDGHRPYRWTMSYLTPAAGYVSHSARVQSNWKPVLVYGGGPRFADVLKSEGSDAGAKDLHYWGQDYGAFHTLIQRLTRPGQTVADPFAGSGTTLLAANALGRHAIGADLDPTAIETARQRVA